MDKDNSICEIPYGGLTIKNLTKNSDYEILLAVLSKQTLFPQHSSKKDVHLILLEGEIEVNINEENIILNKNQILNFPRDMTHSVLAREDSRFLIIR